jgi:hypothetical protein
MFGRALFGTGHGQSPRELPGRGIKTLIAI